MRRKADTATEPDAWTSAHALLKAGTPADQITCDLCGDQWDGTSRSAIPCCVACRALVGRTLRIAADLVLSTAGFADETTTETTDAARTEGTP